MSLLISLLLLSAPSPAPEPALPTVRSADEILKIARASRHPSVVHFWASWCAGCVQEMPEIVRLQRSLDESNTQLILVSLDNTAAAATTVLRRFGLSGPNVVPLLLDAPDPAPLTARFDAHWRAELPATFVVLQSGAVAASHLGTTPVEVILKEVRDQIATPDAGQVAPARRTK